MAFLHAAVLFIGDCVADKHRHIAAETVDKPCDFDIAFMLDDVLGKFFSGGNNACAFAAAAFKIFCPAGLDNDFAVAALILCVKRRYFLRVQLFGFNDFRGDETFLQACFGENLLQVGFFFKKKAQVLFIGRNDIGSFFYP